MANKPIELTDLIKGFLGGGASYVCPQCHNTECMISVHCGCGEESQFCLACFNKGRADFLSYYDAHRTECASLRKAVRISEAIQNDEETEQGGKKHTGASGSDE